VTLTEPDVTEDEFRQFVVEAIDSLPDELAFEMQNVEIVVEDEPPREFIADLPRGHSLLGHYHGVPLTGRGLYDRALPDKISIYRGPITRMSRTRDAIREQVRKTVLHEIGHHFGIGEDRLHELGWG
jgi:predicted Zn-dependent protease with MMP-like domain